MTRHVTGRGRRLLGGLAAAGLIGLGVGLALWSVSPTAGTNDIPGATPSSRAPSSPPPGAGTSATPEPAPWEPGAPRRLVIPALDVSAPVVPVRLAGETLVPPADPRQLGWWADGARPGATRGSALVAGHTVHGGGGALDHLEDAAPGDQVVVRTDRGRIAYEVASVRVFGKGRLADQAERLFSQEAPGRLVVVTCEDWNGSRYLSNVVVTAIPVPG